MVQRLHKLGIKVGIITNGHFLVQRNKLKACKADLLFDTILLVGGEEPNQKPHKSIFLKACSLARCKPEETKMAGDNLKTDIQGAQNAGFSATVWVNLHNLEDLPAGGATPDHIISNILEIPGLLNSSFHRDYWIHHSVASEINQTLVFVNPNKNVSRAFQAGRGRDESLYSAS